MCRHRLWMANVCVCLCVWLHSIINKSFYSVSFNSFICWTTIWHILVDYFSLNATAAYDDLPIKEFLESDELTLLAAINHCDKLIFAHTISEDENCLVFYKIPQIGRSSSHIIVNGTATQATATAATSSVNDVMPLGILTLEGGLAKSIYNSVSRVFSPHVAKVNWHIPQTTTTTTSPTHLFRLVLHVVTSVRVRGRYSHCSETFPFSNILAICLLLSTEHVNVFAYETTQLNEFNARKTNTTTIIHLFRYSIPDLPSAMFLYVTVCQYSRYPCMFAYKWKKIVCSVFFSAFSLSLHTIVRNVTAFTQKIQYPADLEILIENLHSSLSTTLGLPQSSKQRISLLFFTVFQFSFDSLIPRNM